MNKKIWIFIIMLAVLSAGAVGITKLVGSKEDKKKENDKEVVTSFYPMYVLTENLMDGVDGVSVINLTENHTGCLHDYQLTTKDMKKIADADCFIMNGGGMEGFIEDITDSYPNINVVNASDGISMLTSTETHDHDHEEEMVDDEDHVEDEDHAEEEDHEHDHGEFNAHVWMNMDNYLIQIDNVKKALISLDPEHKEAYEKNAKEYSDKVKEIKKEYDEQLQNPVNKDVIIFHDAFAYLAQQLGLNVIYTIDMDSDTSLSAGEVKEIINEVNKHDVKILFTEEQFSESIAASVANETNAKVYVIDSLVTGDNSKDSYLNGMKENLKMLKKALYE